MSETAILLTGGLLATDDAKTAHGLVRGPSRFRLLGVVASQLVAAFGG